MAVNQQTLSSFGKKLKEIRKKKGFSQYQLASEADIDRGLLVNIEKGRVNTSLSTITLLAKALKIPPKDLMDF